MEKRGWEIVDGADEGGVAVRGSGMIEEYQFNRNYYEWMHFNNLLETLTASESGGIVFGGAVRDMMIRLYYARQFHQMTSGKATLSYHDASFMPEMKDRLLLPTDIDVFVSKENFPRLCAYLKRQYSILTDESFKKK